MRQATSRLTNGHPILENRLLIEAPSSTAVLRTRQELSDELFASEIDALLSPLPCTPALGNVDPTFETAGGVVLCDR